MRLSEFVVSNMPYDILPTFFNVTTKSAYFRKHHDFEITLQTLKSVHSLVILDCGRLSMWMYSVDLCTLQRCIWNIFELLIFKASGIFVCRVQQPPFSTFTWHLMCSTIESFNNRFLSYSTIRFLVNWKPGKYRWSNWV